MMRLIALVFAVCALSAFGQRAPDIARGTREEAVVRLYGWPKGKSVSEGREIWLYDQFQVLFEGGAVVSVSYVSPTRGARPAGTQFQRPAISVPKESAPSRPMLPQATMPRNAASVPGVRQAAPPLAVPGQLNSPSIVETPVAETPASVAPSGVWMFIRLGSVFLAAGCIIMLVVARRRARALREQVMNKPPPPLQEKTWEDHVAEKLRAASDLSPPPPIIPYLSEEAPSPFWAKTDEKPAPEPVVSNIDLTLELLRKLEWKRFELIVQRYYEGTGIRADCTCIGPDGGIDVKLYRPGEVRSYCYIQCKAWGSEKVPVTKLRELLGVMAADKVSEGVFVTTSDFWPDAREFAEKNRIVAITGSDFVRLFNRLGDEEKRRIIEEVTKGDYTSPSCPSCDTKMVWKETSRFWACPRYPRCRSKPIYGRVGS